MKVYVVSSIWAYEGGPILGIFDSKEKAETFKSLDLADPIKGFEEDDCHWLGIEEWRVH